MSDAPAVASLQPRRLIVFASGRGSNFESLLRRRQEGRLSPDIAGLVTNVPSCGAEELALRHGIPVVSIPHLKLKREQHEEQVLADLRKALALDVVSDQQTWIVLAGYMRLFSATWIRQLYHPQLQAARMVNIHPSLLPSFPGVHSYRQALAYGVSVTGATVHLVTEGLDDGPIVRQKSLEVWPDDIEETLAERGLRLEHELYGSALEDLATKSWAVSTPPGIAGARARVIFEQT